MISLRDAGWDDRERVLTWNGAAEVRMRSLDPRPISVVDHERWFAIRLTDGLTRMWIIEHDGAAVGVVRIERGHPTAAGRIGIVIAADARGRGIGRAAIAAACAADGGPVVADILLDNHASRACFAAVGFTPPAVPQLPPDDRLGASVVRYQWSRP